VVFTSGTTGLPKGVVLSHRNILFVIGAVCDYLQLTAADRYALVLPLSHTYGKSNLLSAVAAGATAVSVEPIQNPRAFLDRLAAERCSILSVVPFHLHVMARHGIPSSCDLSQLRAVTSSGGPLTPSAVDAVGRLLPQTRFFSMYGLTESATRVTYLPPEWLRAKPQSVGRPLRGVQLEIRADDGRVEPPGVVGQVYVRGPNVMQRYLGDPELTASTLESGWLRTGDLGYLDAEGCLFITGRQKEIIKVAGERISPAEIESVVASHPGVADAAVVGAPDPLLGETVWAYVVPTRGSQGLTGVGAYCAARLAPAKVPRKFIVVDRIPRTATGKIRRHLLAGSPAV
jgi:acyl-CoA synthetase (AMP-forming)/AMP-acid ligase II